MDWGSLAGLVLGLIAIILGQWIEGGQISSLIQPAAFVIVLGGTLSAVLLQNGLTNMVRGIRMLRRAFIPHRDFYPELTETINTWSATARMEGFLNLDRHIDTQPDPFITKGLSMVVDGVELQKIRDILDIDINSYERDQRLAIKVWEAAGGYSPTMGILGAVLGLIHIMENLTDPNLLGKGVAVAFVATIYGVSFANLVFLPIANKLKQHLQIEILKREMLADAFLSIKQGEHPLLIEQRMSSYWHQDPNYGA
jgi:chemotaxis protein MotA